MGIIRLIALVALPFVLFFLSLALRSQPVRRLLVWVLSTVAVALAVTVIVAGISEQRARTVLMDALSRQMVAGDTLARAIPKGCPSGVNADDWNAKVETWKTETAKWLGQAFADDANDYPHDCPLEWVRYRLAHFRVKLNTAVLMLKVAP